jgi:hypothetical protein
MEVKERIFQLHYGDNDDTGSDYDDRFLSDGIQDPYDESSVDADTAGDSFPFNGVFYETVYEAGAFA